MDSSSSHSSGTSCSRRRVNINIITWWICGTSTIVVIYFICFRSSPSRQQAAATTTAFSIPLPFAYTFPDLVALSPDNCPVPSPPSPCLSPSASRIITRKKRRRDENSVEDGLARARSAIRAAALAGDTSPNSPNGRAVIVYHNPRAFYQSYREMERRFKVYVYEEGDQPIFHHGPCKEIYTSEGRFINEIEHHDQRFRTRNPLKAHVFFLPFSVTWMVQYVYKRNSHDKTPLQRLASDYVNLISAKHPFWNRTQGADHFMVACHDWGPKVSRGHNHLFGRSIRVLCNANISEGFNPQKDATLPEIHLVGGYISPKLLAIPSPSNSSRPYLAFFAGGVHGPIRPILLRHWQGRDLPEMQVYEYLPKDLDYYDFLLRSNFCLCPSGNEVASPRIVEAIYAECIPVTISKNYVLPFSDVLRWEAFSISVKVSDIPRLKEILIGVSEEKYERLKQGVRAVREHFVFNQPPKRFDVFHMILHSIWLRRINVELI